MKVLLLDNDTPKALDLVRHLGRRGVVVDILSRPGSVAFFSRYCHTALPGRAATVPGMVEEALGIMAGYDAAFALVDDAVEALHRNRGRLPGHIERHLTPADTLEVTFSKVRMNALAHDLGIPVPATMPLDSESGLGDFTREYGFPLMIKGEQGSAGSMIRMACSRTEVVTASQEVKEQERAYRGRPFVQEYVRGPLYIVGGLCREGTLLRVCIHRREAEYPLCGPPVMGVTVGVPILLDYGERIFRALRWNGLANLQFKEDPRTGEFKFLEINPRPWAFIELAHRAGVDMGGAYCAMVTGTELTPDLTFRPGVRLVKLFPDGLLYLWAHPREIPRMVRRLASLRCSTTVARDDIRPNVYQLKRLYWELLRDLRDGSVRADRADRERITTALRAHPTFYPMSTECAQSLCRSDLRIR